MQILPNIAFTKFEKGVVVFEYDATWVTEIKWELAYDRKPAQAAVSLTT